jgi:hypothetical protein
MRRSLDLPLPQKFAGARLGALRNGQMPADAGKRRRDF